MATGRDTLRIVTLSAGGRPVQVLDLNDASGYWRDREAGFQFTPAAVSQQVSRRAQRFGGGRVVGEIHDNGAIGWTAYVRGSTVAECSQRVEALLAQVNDTARGKYVEWAPDTLASSFLELAGPGSWIPVYDPLMLSQSQAMKVQISFPVLPLVRWAPMTIGDDFSIDTLAADYTGDSTSFGLSVSAGTLTAGSNLTVERRYRHTARGYTALEGQATIKSVPGATITGYKAGVILRAAASTYVEIYVDDNGTNSRLRIDVVIAGVRTNRATTNLAARIINGQSFWVRGRIEGQIVYAEHFGAGFATAPRANSTITTSTSYTLSGGEPASLVAGHSGWSWIPQTAAATLDEFAFQPYIWRNMTLPQLVKPLDAIPGIAPALTAAHLTTSSADTSTPIWPLLAWGVVSDPGLTDKPPFGIFEAESFINLSGGWASSVQAGARGGNDLRVTTAGAATYVGELQCSYGIEADGFTDSAFDVEVWARVLLTSTLVTPRLRLSLRAAATIDSIEFGSTGKLLTVPSAGSVYRMVRLGTLTLETDQSRVLRFTGTVAGGSSGAFGIDYVVVVPARRRALFPTGVAASTVTSFVPSTVGWDKYIDSDLSGEIDNSSTGRSRSVGMGGALIEPSVGADWWLLKLSSLVPDDPTSDTTTELLAHTTTLALDVTPRSFMLRGS
jgi:hypothetical protein